VSGWVSDFSSFFPSYCEEAGSWTTTTKGEGRPKEKEWGRVLDCPFLEEGLVTRSVCAQRSLKAIQRALIWCCHFRSRPNQCSQQDIYFVRPGGTLRTGLGRKVWHGGLCGAHLGCEKGLERSRFWVFLPGPSLPFSQPTLDGPFRFDSTEQFFSYNFSLR
jgi:hypothetical protein